MVTRPLTQRRQQERFLQLTTHTGWGKSRFAVVVRETESLFLYYLFIIELFSLRTTVNLLLLHSVYLLLTALKYGWFTKWESMHAFIHSFIPQVFTGSPWAGRRGALLEAVRMAGN